jgi:hypothetical protein
MSDTTADIDRVWTLINDIPVAMVVPHDGQGQHMRVRPVAMRPVPEEGAIYLGFDPVRQGREPSALSRHDAVASKPYDLCI